MTLELLQALQTDAGRRLLDALAGEALDDDRLLPTLERWRKDYPAELVSAAVELTRLRRRAAAKFPAPQAMFFTREGLEMTSAAPVARHTARRFAGMPRVLDLCCGLGGDCLALAETARRVIAVERDPLALEMARANARVLALHDRIDFLRADVTQFVAAHPLTGQADAIFIDPSRRETGRRTSLLPEEYSPPLSWCLELIRLAPRVAVKVSPALDYDLVFARVPAEVEIVSLAGECKEAVLWLGEFRTCAARATVLPEGDTLTDLGPTTAEIGEIGAWLYEPDGAVVRAHLVQRLAGELGLRRIDDDIAYLTGETEIVSPLLRGFRVQEVVPWGLKRLNAALAARGVGQATIKKRGFPLTPDELRPKLKLTGTAHATLICTRARGKAVVIICGDATLSRRATAGRREDAG